MTLPSDIDANFIPSLYAVAKQLNSDPVNLAMSLYSESDIKATARNAEGCLGINQMCPVNFSSLGIDPKTYTTLPASQQLCHYVLPFWKNIMQRHGLSQLSARDIEWLNYVPAYYVPNAPDDHVIMQASNPNYDKALDHGNKGYITAGDISFFVQSRCTGSRWASIYAAILAGAPLGGVLAGGAGMIALLLGIAGYFFWKGRVLG